MSIHINRICIQYESLPTVELYYNVLSRSVKISTLYPRYIKSNTIEYGSASYGTAHCGTL